MLMVCKKGRGVIPDTPHRDETSILVQNPAFASHARNRRAYALMSRLILYLAIAAVAYYFYRALRRPQTPQPRRMRAHDTVRCECCGVHLAADEAVNDGSHHYCSEEHRRLAARNRD